MNHNLWQAEQLNNDYQREAQQQAEHARQAQLNRQRNHYNRPRRRRS